MHRDPRPLLGLLLLALGCSSGGGSPSGTGGVGMTGGAGGAPMAGTGGSGVLGGGGGAMPSGGAGATGGAATGGVASGGVSTGGFSAGGAFTGGAATGGNASGGAPTGGTTAGSSGGDVTSGGMATGGGAPMGGVATGGAPTGGVATGGSEAGGAAAGGTSTGGAESGGTGGSSGGDCAGPTPGTSGQNPLFTDRYTADPAAMVHDCTFYIACGHDEGSTGFVMRDWYILSSTDMVNWTDNGGPALRVTDFAWADANAWAGHLTARDGRFYWYVPINQRGGAMTIGVAVASNPTGPYQDAIGEPLVSDSIEMDNWNFSDPGETPYTIDPAVFIDDDGQAYFYYGGFWRLVGGRLNADMISLDGALQELRITGAPGAGGYWEAPYMIKRNGAYYMIYAAGQNPATIDYATGSNPLGPFAYRGRILGQLPNVAGQDAATNHAGFAEFVGQWYIVYHLSNGPNGGGTYRREVAVDKMFFNEDGTIQTVSPSSGLTF